MRRTFSIALLLSLVALSAAPLLAQRRQNLQQGARQQANQGEKVAPLPNDQRLLKLHTEFVKKAEDLATEYERDGELDRAQAVYLEILKLVPAYRRARVRLQEIRAKEVTAEKVHFDVWADRDWQDTGVITIPGKPIQMAATGQWTCKLTHKLGPTGMTLPEVLDDLPLGALIGIIITGQKDEKVQPFLIGAGTTFVAQSAGRLMVRMHDTQSTDNEGRIALEIHGTFHKAGKRK